MNQTALIEQLEHFVEDVNTRVQTTNTTIEPYIEQLKKIIVPYLEHTKDV